MVRGHRVGGSGFGSRKETLSLHLRDTLPDDLRDHFNDLLLDALIHNANYVLQGCLAVAFFVIAILLLIGTVFGAVLRHILGP